MDHADAVSSQAVERYLLGQMPDSEAESFEKHFFECAVCTRELEAGAILADNLPAAVVHEPIAAPAAARRPALPKTSNWSWLKDLWRRPAFAAPSFATATLACVVAWQATQLARLNQPQVFVASVLKSATRGAEPRVVVPPGKTHFLLSDLDLDLDLPDSSATSYRFELQDASGRAVFHVDHPAPAPGSPLILMVPVRGLHSGAYTLRVHGVRNLVAGPEIARYSFLLQIP